MDSSNITSDNHNFIFDTVNNDYLSAILDFDSRKNINKKNPLEVNLEDQLFVMKTRTSLLQINISNSCLLHKPKLYKSV